MFATTLTEGDVARLLSSPELAGPAGSLVGPCPRVRLLRGRGQVFAVAGPAGEFVVRFPADEAALSRLRHEERVRRGMGRVVPVRVPDTRVVVPGDGQPVFAIHRMIPGKDWEHYRYEDLSDEARSALAADLIGFLHATHSVPLSDACEWLGIGYTGESTRKELARLEGKPGWFAPANVAEIGRRLLHRLDGELTDLFEDTAERFERLEALPEHMVFGHGDLHGGNLALVEDGIGPRLVGVFDLENAGILDIHYDFCRLNLIDDDLQDRVVVGYRALHERSRPLDGNRIEIYSRAFLLYLMGEQPEADGRISVARLANYQSLVELLRRHVEHHDARRGPLGRAS